MAPLPFLALKLCYRWFLKALWPVGIIWTPCQLWHISWLLPHSSLKMASLSCSSWIHPLHELLPILGFQFPILGLFQPSGSLLSQNSPCYDITVNISTPQIQVQFDYFGPDQAAGTPNPCAIFQREGEISPRGGQRGLVHESWWRHVGWRTEACDQRSDIWNEQPACPKPSPYLLIKDIHLVNVLFTVCKAFSFLFIIYLTN